MSKVILVYGPNGSGKSSFVQSSQRSKWYAELDPGSYDRAKKTRAPIEVQTFYEPLTALEDMGFLDRSMQGASGKGAVQVAHKYTGWRETYWDFVKAYLDFLKSDTHEYGVIDTSTVLWNMAQNALRQRLQEEGGPRDIQSDRLKRLEYQEPNDQLMSMIKGAKGAKKDLVLVAHRGEVWFNDQPTGKWKPDGWNKALDNADIGLMFEVRSSKPVAIITKAGGCPLELVGWELENPTLDDVIALVDAAKAISDSDEYTLPTEGDYSERVATVLGLAEMV